MKEAKGNLWDYPADARVITTNGTVKENGYAVMGRGCAFQACSRYPGMEKRLGNCLILYGNIVQCWRMASDDYLLTYPVKHNWNEKADSALIIRSAHQLVDKIDGLHGLHGLKIESIVMPRPGCGNGRLDWDDVKPTIENILDDRFTVITFA